MYAVLKGEPLALNIERADFVVTVNSFVVICGFGDYLNRYGSCSD